MKIKSQKEKIIKKNFKGFFFIKKKKKESTQQKKSISKSI